MPDSSAVLKLEFGIADRIPFHLEMVQVMVSEISAEDLRALSQQALLVAEEGRFTLHPLIEALVQKRFTEVAQAHKQALSYYQTHYQLWDGTIASCQEAFEVFHHNCELGKYDAAYKVINHYYSVLEKAGYWGDLLPLYQQLADQWQLPDDEMKGQSLVWSWIRLGGLSAGTGNYKEAIFICKKADEIAETYHYLEGKAASLVQLGSAYGALGQYQQAKNSYQQSLAIQKSIGNRNGEAASLNNLGLTCYSLGQYQQAKDFYQQSLVIQKSIGNRSGEAASITNLGLTCDSLGQYQEAINYHQQSLTIQKEIGDRSGEAASLRGLGSACYSLGQYQRAIDFYQHSLAIGQDINYRRGEAASLRGLGSVCYSLGQYQQAIDFYQRSLVICRDISDCRGEADSLRCLGRAYSSLGQYQRAIDFHQQSLAIQQEIADRSSEALSYWNLNNCYQQRGRLKRAMYYRHQAYRLWQEIQLPIAAAPLPNYLKNLCQKMEIDDDWAQALLEIERKMAWFLPLGYVALAIRKLLTPLIALQRALKTHKNNSTKNRFVDDFQKRS